MHPLLKPRTMSLRTALLTVLLCFFALVYVGALLFIASPFEVM